MRHAIVAEYSNEIPNEGEQPPPDRTRWDRYNRHNRPRTEEDRWQRHYRHQSPGTLTADTETGQSTQDRDN